MYVTVISKTWDISPNKRFKQVYNNSIWSPQIHYSIEHVIYSFTDPNTSRLKTVHLYQEQRGVFHHLLKFLQELWGLCFVDCATVVGHFHREIGVRFSLRWGFQYGCPYSQNSSLWRVYDGRKFPYAKHP